MTTKRLKSSSTFNDASPMKSLIAASLLPDLLFTVVTWIDPTSYTHGLIRLSQVCRHWRYAILSNPSLWRKITSSNLSLSLVNMALTRSANCSLEVTFNFDHCGWPLPTTESLIRFCDLIFVHISRIGTVILSGIWVGDEKTLDYILSFLDNTPSELRLVRFHHHCLAFNSSQRVPENLLRKIAPGLRELSISDVSFPSQIRPIFKSMTRLSFVGVRGITSTVQLFDILEASSSNLKVLELINLSDLSSNGDDHDGRSIHFSFLQSLSLGLQPFPLMHILDHIEFPSNIDWSIHCFSPREDSFVTSLLRFLKHVQTPGTFLDLRLTGSNGVMVPDTLHMTFRNSVATPLSASLKMPVSSDQNFINQLERLFANLGFSEASCCSVYITSFLPYSFTCLFRSIFLLLSGLQELIIICERDKTISLPLVVEQLRPVETLPCPQLINLTLEPVTTADKSWLQVLEERKTAGNYLTNIRVVVEPCHTAIGRDLQMLAQNVVLLIKRNRV